MSEVARKRKKRTQVGFGMQKAVPFLNMTDRTIRRHIKEAREGKAEIPIPYIQYVKGGDITFIPSELRLWQWNRTNGITT